jgi:hypothetical protein
MGQGQTRQANAVWWVERAKRITRRARSKVGRRMQGYGVVEVEGTLGYQSARIGLRAPRVAVRVETRDNWQSMFGPALSVASGSWGGYGFIYVPTGSGILHPALARSCGHPGTSRLRTRWWLGPKPRVGGRAELTLIHFCGVFYHAVTELER